MTASPSSKSLTPADYASAASTLGVSIASVRAIVEVESRGDGFMANGHPVILFERHVMYRLLKEKMGRARADELAEKHPDIVSVTPGAYGRESEQPRRLERAAEIDRDCALQSASWGLFQIMGFNWRPLGYATLQTFINAMYKNESAQLHAFCRFIQVSPSLHQALKSRDWAKVARLYNGPNYTINQYDVRLAKAYAKQLKEAA